MANSEPVTSRFVKTILSGPLQWTADRIGLNVRSQAGDSANGERLDVNFVRANILFASTALVSVTLLGIVCGLNEERRLVWNLLLVALAAFQAGAAVGFLYATFGGEVERFDSATKVVNGFLGGAAITDLAKGDNSSVLLRGLRSLAVGTGTNGVGVIVATIVAFGVLGFFITYINKKLFLNVLTARQERLITREEQDVLNREVPVSRTEPGERPNVSPDVKLVASAVASSARLDTNADVESIKAYSKALWIDGQMDRAEDALRVAIKKYPTDLDLPYYLASILLDADKVAEAVPVLRQLMQRPGARALAWKLLGYAYLFSPSTLADSESATRKYLVLRPKDRGAKLNLACVYGQRGPKDARAREELRVLIPDLAKWGQYRRMIKSLTKRGGDFEAWAHDKEFNGWLKG